ncbi:hypothetical protein STEG23_031665, partial [Scotinomys teguina]
MEQPRTLHAQVPGITGRTGNNGKTCQTHKQLQSPLAFSKTSSTFTPATPRGQNVLIHPEKSWKGRHSPTGILMQREDVILEWVFLPCKPNRKLKTYIEKISDLIHKSKLRLHQLTGTDPAEIVVPLTNEQVSSLWKDNEYWQRACNNFLGEINNRYPKSKRIEFIKKTEWVLPHIVRQKPISGVLTFYTDANKLGKAGYKSGDLSKVVQSPYNSVQKAELYTILMVLMDFTEPLNIATDSQYAERVVLHIETAEFIPDNTELTSLFIQLQEIIRNREHPIYNTHQIPYRAARTSSTRTAALRTKSRMCQLSWFLDPGGWSKTTAVGLYFIFPEICTLSLECGFDEVPCK